MKSPLGSNIGPERISTAKISSVSDIRFIKVVIHPTRYKSITEAFEAGETPSQGISLKIISVRIADKLFFGDYIYHTFR